MKMNVGKYRRVLEAPCIKKLGRVSQVVGLTIESVGPDVRLGDMCEIKANKYAKPVVSEVVGFRNNNILLMPLDDMRGVGPGGIVCAADKPLTVKVSDKLLGRVIDGLGNPIDGKSKLISGEDKKITNPPPDPLTRNRIKDPLPLGIKAIDALLTIGKGQRVGIFSGSGVGKSTLIGMIARNTRASVNVIALIGERGREVREFLERDLGADGLKRSVVVIATSDKPALVRIKAADVATCVAEYFREQGHDVLFLMDSLTRYAMAQREVGLATGEPPVSKGYTPSVFAAMPKLLERAGMSENGSVTGMYTVLVDGDDMTEPVTDTARGILDGHIVLSRKISNRNQYPAIDILASISRVMPDVVTKEHKSAANAAKKIMAVYQDAEDLINVGAYAAGSNPEIDDAIERYPHIRALITQQVEEAFGFEETVSELQKIIS